MEPEEPSGTRKTSLWMGDSLLRAKIELISEATQAIIALIIVVTTSIAIFIGRVVQQEGRVPMPSEWWAIVGLVIGFYFGRAKPPTVTEHTGPKR